MPLPAAPRRRALPPLALVVAAACSQPAKPPAQAASPPAAHFDWAAWKAPVVDSLPDDSLGRSIKRGLALMVHTTDSLPGYAPGKLTCTNCHQENGTKATAAPLTGSLARFPKYMPRSGAVIALQDRVNYCFTRSLAGNRLPVDSREMTDIVNYIAYISRGVPVGTKAHDDGLIPMPNKLVGDPAKGQQLFAEQCAACHGPDGAGVATNPALWGPKSFSIGASMAREERAASFIWRNMPFSKPGSLTEQQAFDVAAYVVRQSRPDSPNKELDWPAGGAPYDVPYATKGHEPYVKVAVLPRAHAELGDVPNPPHAPATPRR